MRTAEVMCRVLSMAYPDDALTVRQVQFLLCRPAAVHDPERAFLTTFCALCAGGGYGGGAAYGGSGGYGGQQSAWD